MDLGYARLSVICVWLDDFILSQTVCFPPLPTASSTFVNFHSNLCIVRFVTNSWLVRIEPESRSRTRHGKFFEIPIMNSYSVLPHLRPEPKVARVLVSVGNPRTFQFTLCSYKSPIYSIGMLLLGNFTLDNIGSKEF